MPKKVRSSCEIPVRGRRKTAGTNRRYAFQEDYSWKGIAAEAYKAGGDDWAGIARNVIIGNHGEASQFHLRYFEIEPGGYSSLEQHKHEHVVVGIRGRGKAFLSGRTTDINYLDILYVKPDAPHRLFNPFEEPFGFFCIVDAARDRPRPVKD